MNFFLTSVLIHLSAFSIWSWGPWLLSAVACLLLGVGILNVLSADTIIRRRYSIGLSKGLHNLKPGADAPRRPSFKSQETEGVFVARSLTHVIFPFVMFGLGFLYSEHIHTSSLYPFSEMEVISKTDNYSYWVLFKGDPMPFNLKTCHVAGNLVDWDPGMTIDGAYEDTGGCKLFSVHGAWYKVKRDPLTSKFIDFRQEKRNE